MVALSYICLANATLSDILMDNQLNLNRTHLYNAMTNTTTRDHFSKTI